MIYISAIYANPEHTLVTGTDANGYTETVAHDYKVFRLPDHGPVGFVANGGVIPDYAAPPPSSADVDAERDRRVAAGFVFGGATFQSRPEDRENLAGASTAALAAMVQDAQPNDLRWHGGDSDFVWIAADNSLVPLDAQSMFALGQAAMAHKQAMIFATRAIKDSDPIPSDYATNDAYWPSA